MLNTKCSLKKTQYWVTFTDLANKFSICMIVMETESKHWNYIIPHLLLFSLWAGRSEDRIPVGGKIFRTRPYLTWSPPSLLYSAYRVVSGGKAAGAWRWPPTLHTRSKINFWKLKFVIFGHLVRLYRTVE